MAKERDLNLTGSVAEGRSSDYLQLLDQFPFRPTLFLGLGGTGSQAVAKIKELFLQLVTPQAKARMKADAPELDQLYSFAAFDTNTGERPKNLDAQREWFHLGVRDLRGFYEGIGKQPEFESWVIKDFPAGAITAGASGFRNLGRLALLFNINNVKRAIEQKYSQIIAAAARPTTVNPVPIVYVCCSLSGGTGSGMLLDLCFLLREMLGPAGEVIGLIGLLDGLPTMASTKRQSMLINTFCALKELNAFMARTAEGVKFGDRIEYPFDVAGRVEEPFSECYLISPYRQDGTKNLPSQSHVTSFMARYAFMMSAFSFTPDRVAETPDWAGVMVNQKDQLAKTQAGAKTCYIAPGLAQTHFPVRDVANIVALEAASRYLRYQCGGTAIPGEDAARSFVSSSKLDFKALRDRIGVDPQSKKSAPLAAVRYDDAIKSLLESDDRYQHSEEILAYGKKLPAGRIAEIEKRLLPNVAKLGGEIWPAIYTRIGELLATDGALGVGALDFAEDLIVVLEQERDYLLTDGRKRIDVEIQDVQRQWNEIMPLIEDVVTDEGMISRIADKFKVGKAQMLYSSLLNEADVVILEKTRNELTGRLFNLLIDRLRAVSAELARLIRTDLPRAIQQIEQRNRQLHTNLRQEAEGTDSRVENVCSVSVMNQEWIDAYTKSYGLTADSVLSNLLKRDWHPLRLLEEKPVDGGDIATRLAQVIVDQVEPLSEQIRAWAPIDVLRKTGELRGLSPEDAVARLFYNLQPQMQISSMRTHLGTAAHDVIVTGGLDSELIAVLKASDSLAGEDKLTQARNQEAHRINFFSATLPIALAGSDLVRNHFEPAYNRWMEELSRMKPKDQDHELRLYHCFPNSHQWPSPTRSTLGLEREKRLFACALALSEMLPVSEPDRKRMNTVRDMKEPGYAVFQVGKSSYWIWQFFQPTNEGAAGGKGQRGTAIKGKPEALGTNVLDAYEALTKRPDLQKEAHGWVNWFETNFDQRFNAVEIEALKQKAIEGFNERKGRTTSPKHVALWDDLIAAVEQWQL